MQKETRYLIWNTAGLVLSYLAVAMPLPVISVFVAEDLGFSNALSGLGVGIAFLATILTRGFAGGFADRHGGKACMMRGLLLYAASGVVCFLAGLSAANPALSFGLLTTGRLLLGAGESMALIGMLIWNIALLGPNRSGVVFAMVGAGLYGTFALGGPLGLLCADRFGFAGMMLATVPLPLLGYLMLSKTPAALPQPAKREQSFFRIMRMIWRQCAVVCLQGVGFAAISAFVSLYFSSRGWQHAGLALTCFGAGFVLVRLTLGHLPDRIGGMRTATASLALAACGQMLLWQASSPEAALTGAFFTGLGCSLVYPAMGVEVVRQVRPELRGTAVGGFALFQDVAYGATAPIAGLFADYCGYGAVFMFGFAAAVLGLLVAAISTLRNTRAQDTPA